jgi:glycosyltransferase involved in cell wall biosynthesis
MKKRETIIYVAPSLPSFVKNDIAALSEKYQVKINTYNWKKKQFSPFYLLHQFFFFVFRSFGATAVIISFGGLWSVIPSILGKFFGTPVFIILNGTDCASIPPLKYGSLRMNRIRRACEISYKNCNLLLPVSGSLVKVKNTYYADDAFSFQGFRHFFPKLKTPYQTIFNGVDIDFWKKPEDVEKVPGSFVTVFNPQQFFLKGGDLIADIASKFPNLTFSIAGCKQPESLSSCPENLNFLGRMTPEKLREVYSRSQFHFQLSIFEGFGVSLCEAMLCECIPIVSSVNMLPEIIGDTGFVLKTRNENELETIIKKATSIDLGKSGALARKRIAENYNQEKRKQALFSTIQKFSENDNS